MKRKVNKFIFEVKGTENGSKSWTIKTKNEKCFIVVFVPAIIHHKPANKWPQHFSVHFLNLYLNHQAILFKSFGIA